MQPTIANLHVKNAFGFMFRSMNDANVSFPIKSTKNIVVTGCGEPTRNILPQAKTRTPNNKLLRLVLNVRWSKPPPSQIHQKNSPGILTEDGGNQGDLGPPLPQKMPNLSFFSPNLCHRGCKRHFSCDIFVNVFNRPPLGGQTLV